MIQLKKEYDLRNNEAVALISNCKPQFRMEFTSVLKKYFNIKIFGQCSTMIFWKKILNLNYSSLIGKIFSALFSFFDSFFSSGGCGRDSAYSSCEFNLLKEPKFFLSFESKNRSNYITEKFWRILR